LAHGISELDELYRAPLSWPQAERTDNIENTFLKVAVLSKSTLKPQTSLSFNAIESRFIIGLTFRLILRDVIFSSHGEIITVFEQGGHLGNLSNAAVQKTILEALAGLKTSSP